MQEQHYVIGSGPAGVACAKALLARGASVVMLDAGIQLESDRADLVRTFASQSPSDWKADQLKLLKGMAGDATGVPLKLVFGSDFPYREADEKIPWRGRGIGLKPSLALGGLSNVWGGAMLPYRSDEMTDWPMNAQQLATHYRAVTELTGLSAQSDDLEELFPLHCDRPGVLKFSRQSKLLLGNLSRHRSALQGRGWRFGRSRLAVRAQRPESEGCVYCGGCMHGCVYGYIYNSADTLKEFRLEKNIIYQSDVIVSSVREDSGQVFIEGFHRETGQPLSFQAGRVYLAAGVIPTAQILLRSLGAYDRPVILRDSQYFLFPLLLARATPDVETEALYTLSQMFIEIKRPDLGNRSVHLQFYSYSDLIGEALRKTLGPLKILAPFLEQRMIIAQGYLHSDQSPSISMTLKRDGDKDFLQLEGLPNPASRPAIRKVLKELLFQSWRLGGMIVPPMLQIAEPGRSYHCGGSFPMRREPGPFETDSLGRPQGLSRVHIVDASVLPAIPATTITFSVMANAHRVGWEAATL